MAFSEGRWNISPGNGSVENSSGILKRNTNSISTELQAVIVIILQVLIVVGNTLTMLIVLRLRKRLVVVDVLIYPRCL